MNTQEFSDYQKLQEDNNQLRFNQNKLILAINGLLDQRASHSGKYQEMARVYAKQLLKELEGVINMTHYPASQACNRVQAHPELKPYYDIICEYDWPNIQDHIDWVCTAPIAEIEAWAKVIREDEKEAA